MGLKIKLWSTFCDIVSIIKIECLWKLEVIYIILGKVGEQKVP